jgi:hypothetical protein
MKPTLLDAIDVTEVTPVSFPYSKEIKPGETITSVQIICTDEKGIDLTPALFLSGSASILADTSEVIQMVDGRVGGPIYKMKCVATMSSGRKLTRIARMPVVDY